jgi:glycosyltransferase involved in cell wall biosynthesis
LRAFVKNRIKAYIYPNSSKTGDRAVNPYKWNFANSLSAQVDFVNLQAPTEYGIFDILRYYPSLQYIFLHWPEEVPDKKGGKAQAALLMSLMMLSKVLSKKTVYILHNKKSHYEKNSRTKQRLMSFLTRHSDYVVTHASDGIRHLSALGRRKNTIFLHHPVQPIEPVETDRSFKRYDVLLWGTITPYKGIDVFLENLYRYEYENRFRIQIIGRIDDENYGRKLAAYRSDRIHIENRSPGRSELNSLMAASEHILFTYLKESVLSSGALMDSLAAGCKIIGPDTGAFKDLHDQRMIETYDDYAALFHILLKGSDVWDHDWKKRLESFIEQNTWEAFGKNLMNKFRDVEM